MGALGLTIRCENWWNDAHTTIEGKSKMCKLQSTLGSYSKGCLHQSHTECQSERYKQQNTLESYSKKCLLQTTKECHSKMCKINTSLDSYSKRC